MLFMQLVTFSENMNSKSSPSLQLFRLINLLTFDVQTLKTYGIKIQAFMQDQNKYCLQ